MRALNSLLLGALCCGFMACGSAAAKETSTSSNLDATNSNYYTISQDTRVCIAPPCGGFFVKQVNSEFTFCPNGTVSAACYVDGLDVSKLGLDQNQEGVLRAQVSQFLLRGTIAPVSDQTPGNFGVFRASEAWRGHTGVAPSGLFYRVKDAGINCITFPCPSLTGELLNVGQTGEQFAELRLDGIGQDPKDAQLQLTRPEGVLVAASPIKVSGPAGTATGLQASEYFIPFSAITNSCQPGQLC